MGWYKRIPLALERELRIMLYEYRVRPAPIDVYNSIRDALAAEQLKSPLGDSPAQSKGDRAHRCVLVPRLYSYQPTVSLTYESDSQSGVDVIHHGKQARVFHGGGDRASKRLHR